MCLYPKLILNKKYCSTKKNKGVIPPCPDERLRYVTAACGECYECRKQKQRAWVTRMTEELKQNPNAGFYTLTIDDEHYKKLSKECKSKDENTIATYALRMFLERIRKKLKKSIKHWCITELGHEKSERIHLHGIFWGCGIESIIREKWQNGFIFTGNYVSQRTINYITKYMLKTDLDHPKFKGKVLCSAGIGKGYEKSTNAENNKFKGKDTNETYRLPNGAKTNLPIYYRNKIYSEEEREALFLSKVEKGIIWICGEKCFIDDYSSYINLLEYHRNRASKLYHDNPQNWEEAKYLRRLERQRNTRKKTMRKKASAARTQNYSRLQGNLFGFHTFPLGV